MDPIKYRHVCEDHRSEENYNIFFRSLNNDNKLALFPRNVDNIIVMLQRKTFSYGTLYCLIERSVILRVYDFMIMLMTTKTNSLSKTGTCPTVICCFPVNDRNRKQSVDVSKTSREPRDLTVSITLKLFRSGFLYS